MSLAPRVVGVCGFAGSGKDAFASFLPGYTRMAFADPLKDVARVLFRFTHAQVHGSTEDKETIDPRWGISPREALQRMGTEGGRQGNLREFEKLGISEDHLRFVLALLKVTPGPNCWIDAFTTRLYAHSGNVVVPDVRFENEALAIRMLGGLIVRVDRPGTVRRHTHASEALPFEPDLVIQNDRTLDILRQRAEAFARGEGL